MRIALLSSEFITEDYFSGGLANYLYRLAKELVKHGHVVHIVTRSHTKEVLVIDGINVHRVDSGFIYKVLKRTIFKNIKVFQHIDLIARCLDYSIQAFCILAKLNKRQRFDIIQISNCVGVGFITSLLLRVPHVLRLSSYAPVWNKFSERHNLSSNWFSFLEKKQLCISHYVFAPSQTLKHIVEKNVPMANIRVIRSPFYLETKEFNYDVYQRYLKGRKYLLYFGRLVVRKGVRILAQSLPRVLSEIHDAYAVFVGDVHINLSFDPSEKEFIKQQCNRFIDRVNIFDALRHEKLYPIIMRAHLVVLPSLIDNFPNAMIEAMGLGKPVLATAEGGFGELIKDGVNGFLFESNEPEALSKKILDIWYRDDLDAIGKRAVQAVHEFSPDEAVSQHIELYKEAIRAGR